MGEHDLLACPNRAIAIVCDWIEDTEKHGHGAYEETCEVCQAIALLRALPTANALGGEERLREEMERLLAAAEYVSRVGATPGPHFVKLTGAILSARAALQPAKEG